MKLIFKISFLTLLLIALTNTDVLAQRGKKKKKKTDDTESVAFAQRLWYGGGFGLSFFSSGLPGGLQGNNFAVGISPMAGYKVLPWLSVGPRVEFEYFTGRYQFYGTGQVYKFSAVTWAVGPFLRAKTNFNIFGHLEYQYRNEAFLTGQVTADNKLETVRDSRDALYIGAGYSSSAPGGWGYEMGLYYDAKAPEDVTNIPIQYRLGFTYNF